MRRAEQKQQKAETFSHHGVIWKTIAMLFTAQSSAQALEYFP